MIDIKLAEYNSEGKFEKFLELGKDFLFGGYYILITEKMTLLGVLGLADACSFNRDEKDPLNRFNGLFDGRTYGNGRFVLCEIFGNIFQDDVLKSRWAGCDLDTVQNQPPEEKYYFTQEEVLGNLHENPELYERIEN